LFPEFIKGIFCPRALAEFVGGANKAHYLRKFDIG